MAITRQAPLADAIKSTAAALPLISLNNMSFTATLGDQKTPVHTGETPDGRKFMHCVIVDVDKVTRRAWWSKEYASGEPGEPGCKSSDNISPDQGCSEPQSQTCAACPHNAWGSARQGKGKACRIKHNIVVIVPKFDDHTLFLLRVPTKAIASLGDYLRGVHASGKDVSELVTRITFTTDRSIGFEFGDSWSSLLVREETIQAALDSGAATQLLNEVAPEASPVAPALAAPAPQAALPSPAPAPGTGPADLLARLKAMTTAGGAK